MKRYKFMLNNEEIELNELRGMLDDEVYQEQLNELIIKGKTSLEEITGEDTLDILEIVEEEITYNNEMVLEIINYGELFSELSQVLEQMLKIKDKDYASQTPTEREKYAKLRIERLQIISKLQNSEENFRRVLSGNK